MDTFKPFQTVSNEQENQIDILVTEINRLNKLLMNHIHENENLTKVSVMLLQMYVCVNDWAAYLWSAQNFVGMYARQLS